MSGKTLVTRRRKTWEKQHWQFDVGAACTPVTFLKQSLQSVNLLLHIPSHEREVGGAYFTVTRSPLWCSQWVWNCIVWTAQTGDWRFCAVAEADLQTWKGAYKSEAEKWGEVRRYDSSGRAFTWGVPEQLPLQPFFANPVFIWQMTISVFFLKPTKT